MKSEANISIIYGNDDDSYPWFKRKNYVQLLQKSLALIARPRSEITLRVPEMIKIQSQLAGFSWRFSRRKIIYTPSWRKT